VIKVKICGLFREEDIGYANEANPDFIGFVFAKGKRRVSYGFARKHRGDLKKGIEVVGVFAQAALEEIISLYKGGVIDIAQLHGEESEDYIMELKRACGIPAIKAVSVKTAGCIEKALSSCAEYLLFDGGSGGSGRAFDWKLIGGLDRPYFIAGGIGLENVESACALNPFGIDLSSGAESEGVKDLDKMKEIVRRARSFQFASKPSMS
jgi:phosphoribosylanthranilate isomerase